MGSLGYNFNATNSASNLKNVPPFDSISDFVYKEPKTKDCHFFFNAFCFFLGGRIWYPGSNNIIPAGAEK